MTQIDDFKWFEANREAIIKDHIGQSVVIRNAQILGYFPTDRKALDAMKNEPVGSYIIQRCFPQEQCDFIYYTGRYAF